MPGAAAGRERVRGKEEQTNTGEQDTEMKQAVKKTNIKERSL